MLRLPFITPGMRRVCPDAPTARAPRAHVLRSVSAALTAFCLVVTVLSACASPQAAVQHAPGSSAAHAGLATQTPTATATPGPRQDPRVAYVDALINSMTLDQELGQLFIVEYLYSDPNHADLQTMFGEMNAGGVILYQSMNLFKLDQTQQLTRAMQAAAHIPLIIGADEEGGADDQTSGIFGPHPGASDIGATGNPAVATKDATQIAVELKELGLNTDFAPVVDVESPDRSWLRSFGRSPDMVAKMGIAEVDALQQDGIMACPKHFPGLGAATVNPHDALPVINSSHDYIEQNDLAPYRALMSHQPAMLMTTDLLMPALDPTMPAELSQPIVTGILRDEIGYDGVVVTDALYMGGIADKYPLPQAGVLSIEAGNDMLEGAWSADEMRAMVDALRAAVQAGQLTKARIDDSVRRILLLKLRFGLLHLPRLGTSSAAAQT